MGQLVTCSLLHLMMPGVEVCPEADLLLLPLAFDKGTCLAQRAKISDSTDQRQYGEAASLEELRVRSNYPKSELAT